MSLKEEDRKALIVALLINLVCSTLKLVSSLLQKENSTLTCKNSEKTVTTIAQ